MVWMAALIKMPSVLFLKDFLLLLLFLCTVHGKFNGQFYCSFSVLLNCSMNYRFQAVKGCSATLPSLKSVAYFQLWRVSWRYYASYFSSHWPLYLSVYNNNNNSSRPVVNIIVVSRTEANKFRLGQAFSRLRFSLSLSFQRDGNGHSSE